MMASLFAPEYVWLWAVALGVALFFPVRRLIWVISVRRLERRHGPSDEAQRQSLKKRAGVTAALLCFLFAVFYVGNLFGNGQ